MRRSLLSLLLLSQVGQGALAEPAPAWAEDAVHTLEERQLIQGYPSQSEAGAPAMTRDEMAELLNRVDVQRVHEDSATASKSELKTVQDEVSGIRQDLEEMDARTEDLEQDEEQLKQRRDQTRRPGL